jgi:hypothetical protein
MDDPREKNQVDALIRIEDEAEGDAGIPSEFVLENGVRLRIKRVPPLLIQTTGSKLKRPTPPIVYIEEKGREEENPMSPSYLAAVEDYEFELGTLIINTLLMMGTELIECPNSFPGPADSGWVEPIEFLLGEGIVPENKPKVRYLLWLKYVALSTNDEIQDVARAVYRRVGVTEEDVSRAIDKFRGDTPGDADT